jgi:hypothetical protein
MKRIFTYSIGLFCLLALCQQSFAQTCSVSTTAPAGITFTAPRNVNPAQGFTTTNQSPLGRFANGTYTDLSTPLYYYNAAQSTVYFAYTLSTNNSTSNIYSYFIELHYGFGGYQNASCTGGALPQAVTTTATTFYFAISGVSMPASNNFYILLRMDIPNFEKSINATQFQIGTATPAPAGAALPVLFSRFDAKAINGGAVALTWDIDLEDNVKGYEIERSSDGTSFSKIGFVEASSQKSYSYTDSRPLATGYYRIKSVDIDGKFMYSTIISLKGGRAAIVLRAFPVPVQNQFLTLQHSSANTNSLIRVTSAEGRLIQSIVPAVGSQQTKINLSAAKAGLYLVRFDNGDGETETLKIVKQ